MPETSNMSAEFSLLDLPSLENVNQAEREGIITSYVSLSEKVIFLSYLISLWNILKESEVI